MNRLYTNAGMLYEDIITNVEDLALILVYNMATLKVIWTVSLVFDHLVLLYIALNQGF